MQTASLWIVGVSLLVSGSVLAQDRQTDNTPHTVRLIPVQESVKVEVIDWGGSGPALILLAGLGDTAHVYDKFAPKLVPSFHVSGSHGVASELPVSRRPKMETTLQIASVMTYWG